MAVGGGGGSGGDCGGGGGVTLTLRDRTPLGGALATVVSKQTDDDGARRQLRAAAEAAELPMPVQPPMLRPRVQLADQVPDERQRY